MSVRSMLDARTLVAAQRTLVEQLFASLAATSITTQGGITRDSYGVGETAAHDVIAELGRRLGLEVTRDIAANTYVTLPGLDRRQPRILLGSHLDSVPGGGNFDGAAGVVAGMAILASLVEAHVAPACDVTVMGIRAEESAWFQRSYIGSRAALGTLPPETLDRERIDSHRTLAAHMLECGGDPDRIREGVRTIDPHQIRAFLELHIEQASSLVDANVPVAVCTGIPGNVRFPSARVIGACDHVGTPRHARRDAAVAAAEFASAVDETWACYDAQQIPMRATFGRFHTDVAVHNLTTIPGEFFFSLDVRAYTAETLSTIEHDIVRLAEQIGQRRRVRFELGPRASVPPASMDRRIASELVAHADALGITNVELGSPASHDAAAFSQAGVPTAMLFVRNRNGSHNPNEEMEIDDFLLGTAILMRWVMDAVR